MDNIFSQHYLGVRISQNDNAVPTFDKLLKTLDFSRIIELGTFHGGLSIFLGTYCYMKDIPFITYDIEPFVNEIPKIKTLFNTLNIDYRVRNINDNIPEIVGEIMKPGRNLLLCDGGSKAYEFNLFSNYIKSGDIIMGHDYAYNERVFYEEVKHRLWNWHELQYSQIENAINVNKLQPFMKKEFEQAVWTCWQKS